MSLQRETVIIDVLVKDVARSISFYRDVLGLKLLVKAERWASFAAKNIELHLNLDWGATAGVEFKVDDIRSTVDAMKLRGVHFTSQIETHEWGEIAYFLDSESNQLAIVEEKKST